MRLNDWQDRTEDLQITPGTRYAPLDAVSTDTTESILQEYIYGNKYLQLFANASTGNLTGIVMKTK